MKFISLAGFWSVKSGVSPMPQQYTPSPRFGFRTPCLCFSCHKKHHIFQVPVILELEATMHQLLRQQASRLVQRRQDDIKDESSEFSSLSSQSILKVFIFYLNGLIVPLPPSFSCSDCSIYSYS